MSDHPFDFVPVSTAHAAAFVDALFAAWHTTSALHDAIMASGIMTWPQKWPARTTALNPLAVDVSELIEADKYGNLTPEQEAFLAMEGRIMELLQLYARACLTRAFEDAATHALTDEPQPAR